MQQDPAEFIGSPQALSLLYGENFYMFPEDLGGDVNPVMEAPKLPNAESPLPKAKLEPVIDQPPIVIQKPVTQAQNSELPSIENIPGITWRKKDSSKILFILREEELKNAVLTDLLKKIVEAIGLSFESTGFGIIKGPVGLQEFKNMPVAYGVVFDESIYTGTQNPAPFGENEVFFSQQLQKLDADKNLKMLLWNYLKQLKEKLV